jgi:hypothetical protein
MAREHLTGVYRQASKQHIKGEMMEHKTKVVAIRLTQTEHRAMSRFIGKPIDYDERFTEVVPKNMAELIAWMMSYRLGEMLENDKREVKKEEAKAKRLAKKAAASGL